jgi:hypothetical protein
MKAYSRSRGIELHSFLTSALDLLEWLISFPQQLHHREPHDYEAGWAPGGGMDVKNKNLLPLPGYEPRTVHPRSLIAIPTTLSLFELPVKDVAERDDVWIDFLLS